MDTFKKFARYYAPHKFLFYMDMLCAIVMSCIDLIFPLIVNYLLKTVYVMDSSDKILKYTAFVGLFLLVTYIIRYFCQYFVTSWGHVMGARIEADMRYKIFTHLEKLSFSYYDKHNTGKMMSKIMADLFDIAELSHHGPEDIFISLIKIIGTFIILFTISAPMTLILLIFTLIMLVFSVFYNKKMKPVFAKNRGEIANVNAVVQDSLSGIRVVKSFSNEDLEKKKFQEGNNGFLKSKSSTYMLLGKYFSGNGLFQGVLYMSVLVSGGYFISKGSVDASDLIIYVLYINIFLNPLERLVNFTEQFQIGLSGFTRFLEVIETNPDIVDKKDAIDLKDVRGDISFNNVSFSYDDENMVLDDINLEIKAGRNIALVGPSGGGKTTFTSLLPRFYEVTKGSITIDGKDIRDLTLNSLRKSIGIVQQDVYLFTGSIFENIAYGNPGAKKEEIMEAAKKANIHDFILSLEEGYDTFVGERGVLLSGGQKQRISIARVFLKNPPILILDEATSALDNESEKHIQDSLEELSKNRTTIVIAHRLSTIRKADEIIVLTKDGIKEKGNHRQLLKQGGLYSYFYNMQFEGLSE